LPESILNDVNEDYVKMLKDKAKKERESRKRIRVGGHDPRKRKLRPPSVLRQPARFQDKSRPILQTDDRQNNQLPFSTIAAAPLPSTPGSTSPQHLSKTATQADVPNEESIQLLLGFAETATRHALEKVPAKSKESSTHYSFLQSQEVTTDLEENDPVAGSCPETPQELPSNSQQDNSMTQPPTDTEVSSAHSEQHGDVSSDYEITNENEAPSPPSAPRKQRRKMKRKMGRRGKIPTFNESQESVVLPTLGKR
jgi:hypothetical protein